MKRVLKLIGVLLIVGVGWLTSSWYNQPEDIKFEELRVPIPFKADSRFAMIDGVRLHYQERGAGPVLMLLHGYAASTYTWREVFLGLTARSRVIALDLKGFGFSDKPAGDYTLQTQAGLVMKLLDQLGIQQAVFCGHSMGGAVAVACALNTPERVQRLILVDVGLSNEVVRNSGLIKPLLLKPVVGPLLTAWALRSDALVRKGLALSFYNDALVTEGRVEAHYRPLRTRAGQRAVLLVAQQWDVSEAEKNLTRLEQPTLLIWGAEDRVIPLAHGQYLHNKIDGSKMVVFPECGHIPQIEQPKEFVEEVNAFLQTN